MVFLVSGGPEKSYAQLPEWVEKSPRLVGEARFRLIFFDIYHAALLRQMDVMMDQLLLR